MPAIRNLLIGLDVIQAVVAALFSVRLAAQNGIFSEVTQLHGQLLVDLFRLGFGQLVFVVGHAAHSSAGHPATARSSSLLRSIAASGSLAAAGAGAGRRLRGRPIPNSRIL